MSTEAESLPARGATAIVALAAPAHAPAQTAVIGAAAAAAVAADGAAFFNPPRRGRAVCHRDGAPGRTAAVAAEPARLRAS
jgi:hypothetical protein